MWSFISSVLIQYPNTYCPRYSIINSKAIFRWVTASTTSLTYMFHSCSWFARATSWSVNSYHNQLIDICLIPPLSPQKQTLHLWGNCRKTKRKKKKNLRSQLEKCSFCFERSYEYWLNVGTIFTVQCMYSRKASFKKSLKASVYFTCNKPLPEQGFCSKGM